jgi:hypothetical protein
VQNLLQICDEALREVNVDPPGSIVGGGDMGKQLHYLANSTVRDLIARTAWNDLILEGSFTTVADETQIESMTTTFPNLKKIIDKTLYNRTQQKRILGPLSAQAWARLKSEQGTGVAELHYRLRGDSLLFASVPSAGESCYFEYVDKRCVSNSDGSAFTEYFEGDLDVPRLPDALFVLGVRWRFLHSKGFEYGEAFRSYEDQIEVYLGDQQPAENLSVNPYGSRDLFSDGYVPEGNFNL